MKLLIDAQFPRRIALLLQREGHDIIHTLDLPNKNRTTDSEINRISLDESRIVVTKDSDFVDSFILSGQPHRLLLISTGNISNQDLDDLIRSSLSTISNEFDAGSEFLELSRTGLIIHK